MLRLKLNVLIATSQCSDSAAFSEELATIAYAALRRKVNFLGASSQGSDPLAFEVAARAAGLSSTFNIPMGWLGDKCFSLEKVRTYSLPMGRFLAFPRVLLTPNHVIGISVFNPALFVTHVPGGIVGSKRCKKRWV